MRQIGFCLSALLVGSLAIAQDVLDPLVVTGEREDTAKARGSNVDLDLNRAERLSELLGTTPGLGIVSSDSGGYGDTLSVRGSANTLFFGGASVAMVIDDVPYGDVYTYSTEFFDLDSFVLHRGPQGHRFARNGAGGLIEMRTAAPTDQQTFKLSAEYGSYDSLHLRFRAAGPITDKWSYAVQSYYKERNGYIDNVNPAVGGFNDDREQFGALGSLYYNPSADLQIRLRAMYERTRDGSQRLSALPGSQSAFGPFIDGARAQDPFRVSSDLEGITEIDRYQLSLHLDQDLGWANLKSITSYSNWQLGPSIVDLDLSAIPASNSSISQQQEVYSQEFRLESDREKNIRWTAGLAYLKKDSEGVANRFFGTGQFTFENQFTAFRIDEESTALFGNLQWDLNDVLTVDVGGRIEYIETSLRRDKTGAGNPFPSLFPLPPAVRGEASGTYFTPSLGLTYKITPETSLFARTSVGFKPQGFTAFSDDIATTAFDEERNWETEIGLRYQNSDRSLGFELRGYYKQIDDYQVNRSAGATDFLIINADRVEAIGLEGELTWRPVDRLLIQASAGWTKTEFDDHTGPGGNDLSGNEVPFIPEFTASLGARYDFQSGFFAQTAVRFVGSTFYDEGNSNATRQASYNVWDAEIGYQADNWTVAAFARNLLDEEYYTFINSQISAGSPGDPAVLGLRFGLEF